MLPIAPKIMENSSLLPNCSKEVANTEISPAVGQNEYLIYDVLQSKQSLSSKAPYLEEAEWTHVHKTMKISLSFKD